MSVDTAEQIAQLQAELARVNHAYEDFAYIVAHDLKAPVRGIDNFTKFLAEDYADKLDDEGRNQLQTLSRLAQRLTSLLDALLMFSRAGTTALKFKENAVDEIIQAQIKSLESFIENHKADIVISTMPTIVCDESAIGTVFNNLITNALKFNVADKRRVEIAYQSDENAHVFSVKDNGIGLSIEQQEHIFKVFRRLNGHEEYEGGLGIGLSIAEKLVERHQGKVWFTPNEQGTTFYFSVKKNL